MSLKAVQHSQHNSKTKSNLNNLKKEIFSAPKKKIISNRIMEKSGDSKNFANSISFKNLFANDQILTEKNRLIDLNVQTLTFQKSSEDSKKYNYTKTKEEDKLRPSGFTKKELTSLMQLKFLKKANLKSKK